MFFARQTKRGFTLLELMAVFAVVAMILAVAAPRLLPLATYFGHEGAARELAAYGESAIQYAKLNNEQIHVVFDLETGEYWLEHWVPEEPTKEQAKPKPTTSELQEKVSATLRDPRADKEERAKSAVEMGEHFAAFTEQRLRAQAELVEPNRSREDDSEGFISLGFEPEESEQKMIREELKEALLEKRKLPDNIFFESVSLPEESSTSEYAEVVISPLGLERDVQIKLISEDGDFLTVRWEPIFGRGAVYPGDWEP